MIKDFFSFIPVRITQFLDTTNCNATLESIITYGSMLDIFKNSFNTNHGILNFPKVDRVLPGSPFCLIKNSASTDTDVAYTCALTSYLDALLQRVFITTKLERDGNSSKLNKQLGDVDKQINELGSYTLANAIIPTGLLKYEKEEEIDMLTLPIGTHTFELVKVLYLVRHHPKVELNSSTVINISEFITADTSVLESLSSHNKPVASVKMPAIPVTIPLTVQESFYDDLLYSREGALVVLLMSDAGAEFSIKQFNEIIGIKQQFVNTHSFSGDYLSFQDILFKHRVALGLNKLNVSFLFNPGYSREKEFSNQISACLEKIIELVNKNNASSNLSQLHSFVENYSNINKLAMIAMNSYRLAADGSVLLNGNPIGSVSAEALVIDSIRAILENENLLTAVFCTYIVAYAKANNVDYEIADGSIAINLNCQSLINCFCSSPVV